MSSSKRNINQTIKISLVPWAIEPLENNAYEKLQYIVFYGVRLCQEKQNKSEPATVIAHPIRILILPKKKSIVAKRPFAN